MAATPSVEIVMVDGCSLPSGHWYERTSRARFLVRLVTAVFDDHVQLHKVARRTPVGYSVAMAQLVSQFLESPLRGPVTTSRMRTPPSCR